MTRFLILFSFLLFSASLSQAQNYRPMNEFGTDTLGYLKYNYVDNKSQYTGKSFEFFLNEFELPIGIAGFNQTNPGDFSNSYVNGVNMFYLTPIQTMEYDKAKRIYFWINVYFKPPHTEKFFEKRKILATNKLRESMLAHL